MAARKVTSYPATSFSGSFSYSPEQLRPYDPSSDAAFYSQPRFVNHIDEHAIEALGQYYDEVLPRRSGEGPTPRILDLCSSWVSHIPLGEGSSSGMSVTGVGMNAPELEANPILAEWVVYDLNTEPRVSEALTRTLKGKARADAVPPDTPFDAVICNVSIDYLYQPLEVFEETAKVLKPGGHVYLAISNRCFPTKVGGFVPYQDAADHPCSRRSSRPGWSSRPGTVCSSSPPTFTLPARQLDHSDQVPCITASSRWTLCRNALGMTLCGSSRPREDSDKNVGELVRP